MYHCFTANLNLINLKKYELVRSICVHRRYIYIYIWACIIYDNADREKRHLRTESVVGLKEVGIYKGEANTHMCRMLIVDVSKMA